MILPPRHSEGRLVEVFTDKWSPFTHPPLSSFSPTGGCSSPRDGRTPPATSGGQHSPTADSRASCHTAGRGRTGDGRPPHGRPPARSVTRPKGSGRPVVAENDGPWWRRGVSPNVWEYSNDGRMGPRWLGTRTSPPSHWGSPADFLQSSHGSHGALWWRQEGNPGSSRAVTGVRGPVLSGVGVSTSSAGACPGSRTFTSRAALAHGWSTHGRPGNGTRCYRSPPPGPASNPSASSRYAESHDHAGVSGGDRAGRGGPPPRGWGASAAFPSEGGPGSTRAGGHLAANRQDGGPNPLDESMPTAPPSPCAQTWLAGCILHQDLLTGAPEAMIKINGRPFKALLDSGSAVSLVQAQILPLAEPSGRTTAWNTAGRKCVQWTARIRGQSPILSHTSLLRTACSIVSPSGGGRKKG